jgi:hypothetical protein
MAESADLDSPTNLARQLSTISVMARRQCSISRRITPPATTDSKHNGNVTLEAVENAEKLIQAESIQTG